MNVFSTHREQLLRGAGRWVSGFVSPHLGHGLTSGLLPGVSLQEICSLFTSYKPSLPRTGKEPALLVPTPEKTGVC